MSDVPDRTPSEIAGAGRKPVLEEVLEGGGNLGAFLTPGDVIQLVDLQGKQVPHVVPLATTDGVWKDHEGYSAHFTRVLQQRWRISTGDVLYSDRCRPLMRIVNDTVGINYTGGGFCTKEANLLRYGDPGKGNCLDNLLAACAPLGVRRHEMPGAFAPFMNYTLYEDGHTDLREPESRAGDHIDLKALDDLFIAISNCPQDRNPVNGYRATPIRVIIWRGAISRRTTMSDEGA